MIRREFQAMGTKVEAWSYLDDEGGLSDWFEEVEGVCSRFRANSDLARLNDDPSSAIRLDGILLDVLREAERARTLTDGLVDVGIGAALEKWGYDRSFELVADSDREPFELPVGGWHLDDDVLYRTPGTRIDLGGIAKGWTCDRAVEDGLAEVVSAGGDLRSAHSDTTVSIEDPEGHVVQRVVVGRGALATSSVGHRKWKVGGREVSHLIDPRSLQPVSTPIVSASVIAATAVEAEAGAKAVILNGADGLAWADEQDWISAALVIWHDGTVYGTSGLEMAA